MDQLLIEYAIHFQNYLMTNGLLGIIQFTFVFKCTAELGAGFLMWLSHELANQNNQPK